MLQTKIAKIIHHAKLHGTDDASHSGAKDYTNQACTLTCELDSKLNPSHSTHVLPRLLWFTLVWFDLGIFLQLYLMRASQKQTPTVPVVSVGTIASPD